ncbi:MAG: hypothetical protein HY903_08845 [Deltaproteobacteria bacterium]|nr:hypothetical protein [Deltaproteobacteria bacterium]
MDSKINSQDTGLRVQIDQSRSRQAPRTDFGSVMSTGLSRSADAVLNAGELAAPFIPGGAVLSAAVTGVGSLKSSASGLASSSAGSTGANSSSLGGTGMTGSVSTAGGGTYGVGGTTGGVSATGGPTDMMTAAKQMQELNMSFNMQYLMLQQKMQADNRQFTTLSNIMKTKHDTAKNAINNVR